MKLRGRINNKKTKDENGENFPHLEIIEVVLTHWNFVNNDYQQDSTASCTLVPNKSFGQLLFFLQNFDSEFSYIELWFTDQNSKPLEI